MSYRRDDSSSAAGRLSDHLGDKHGFGNGSSDTLFMDIDDIPPGADYREVIDETLAKSDVVLVVIGRMWLTVPDSGGQRRLDSVSDTHRLEVAGALRSDAQVVPVLVDGAEPPHADDLPDDIADLAYRNAYELTDKRYAQDVAGLADALRTHAEAVRAQRAEVRRARRDEVARKEAEQRDQAERELDLEAERQRAQQAEREEAAARLRKEDAEARYYETLDRKESAPKQRLPDRLPATPRKIAAWCLFLLAALWVFLGVYMPIEYAVSGPNENSTSWGIALLGGAAGIVFAVPTAGLGLWIYPRRLSPVAEQTSTEASGQMLSPPTPVRTADSHPDKPTNPPASWQPPPPPALTPVQPLSPGVRPSDTQPPPPPSQV